jgi:c-di-GMP-binding flagellar brake protein YcgR
MMELETKTVGMQNEDFSTDDRRATHRFPIENHVHYKLLETAHAAQTGQGRTRNMSSGGILFSTETRLALGQRIELAVDWPAQLNEHCGLKLVALGKIVRSDTDTAVVTIEKYDFRTRATAAC